MSMRSSGGAIAREWFWALTCYSLVIAPFGCQLQGVGSARDVLGSAADTIRTGLFINQDSDDPLLMAGRNANGDAFFVFGTRNADGGLEEIESISVRTAAGEEAFITFESGRPVHVQGPDGSYVHISYQEVSAQRLTADVELYDATTTEKHTFQVDIDLEQTAAQIAERVREVTGRELETTALLADELPGKEGRQQVRITIFSPWYAAFVLPLVATIGLMTIVLGQVLVAIYAAVLVTLEAVLLAVFMPLFLIAEICGDVMFRVELIPLWMIFDSLPPPPIVILM